MAKKWDYSHLSLEEIDEELSSIGPNLERDMERLKKQYMKRQKALRIARDAKLRAPSTLAPPSTPCAMGLAGVTDGL